MIHLTQAQYDSLQQAKVERDRLHALVNNPQTSEFLAAVQAEKAHQIQRWGYAHDRSKSAENWFWLVGYLAGKALRAAITGNREKARHHCVSSAAALANWFDAIGTDVSGACVGQDADLAVKDNPIDAEVQAATASIDPRMGTVLESYGAVTQGG